MGQSAKLVYCIADTTPRKRLPPMMDIPPFVAEALGGEPREPKLFERALTHGSHGRDTYERLEFLGDRICSVRQYWDEFAVLEQLGVMTGAE